MNRKIVLFLVVIAIGLLVTMPMVEARSKMKVPKMKTPKATKVKTSDVPSTKTKDTVIVKEKGGGAGDILEDAVVAYAVYSILDDDEDPEYYPEEGTEEQDEQDEQVGWGFEEGSEPYEEAPTTDFPGVITSTVAIAAAMLLVTLRRS